MLLDYVLCLAVGFAAKFADREVSPTRGYAAGLAYGLLGGFLATRSPSFAAVACALVAGELLAGKVDKAAHYLAGAAFFVTVAALGFVQPPIAFFALLCALAILDEWMEAAAEDFPPALSFIARYRLLSDLGALALSLVTGDWVFFIAIACFDLGYQLFDWLDYRLKGGRKWRK